MQSVVNDKFADAPEHHDDPDGQVGYAAAKKECTRISYVCAMGDQREVEGIEGNCQGIRAALSAVWGELTRCLRNPLGVERSS